MVKLGASPPCGGLGRAVPRAEAVVSGLQDGVRRSSSAVASWTFFSTCPFSQPEGGLQNSASQVVLAIAEKRALT